MRVLSILIFILSPGCSFNRSTQQRQFEDAQKLQDQGKYQEALDLYDLIIVRNSGNSLAVRAAREGAKISMVGVKDFNRAITFFRRIMLDSMDPEERLQAQKSIAALYSEQLNDPEKSILELNKLLSMLKDPEEEFKYRLNLARAYYYKKNLSQSLVEIQTLEKMKGLKADIFPVLSLKGNVFLSQKDLTQATATFQTLVKMDAKRSVKENIAIALSVAFEEMKDFNSAISTLEEMKKYHPQPEYIDIRIQRLKERKSVQPGAKGMRK